jgi:signal transduction histidine kinase
VVLGILLVVIAHDTLAVRQDIRDYEARIADDIANMGYGLSITLPRMVRDGGPAAAEALLEHRNDGNRIRVRWVALDVPASDGRAVDLPVPLATALREGQPARLIRGSGSAARLFVYRPFAGQKPAHDLVEASESLALMHDRETRRITGVIVESIAILALAGFSAVVLGLRFVARPVQRLVAQARRIGAGDLSQRLQLAGHHELSELAIEMNLMCDHLVETREELAAESAAKLAVVEQVRHADRLATVGQLASGVAHELGTPLNVVAGYAKMISSAEGTPDEDRDGARIIAEQAARMTAIIRQLLDFARGAKPQLQVGDLAAVASHTVTMLAHLATQHHVELRLAPTLGTDGLRVRMDESQMQQVITNLVINAIQAMPRGGRVDIDLGAARASRPGHGTGERDCVRLSIADQGAGIATEAMPHIFEPFFTTKDVGEGTGLGLSVCYGIVEEHGGWITVDSTLGQGSRFSVYLPVADDGATEPRS